ncbi:hypothetical protein K2X89_12450 [Myxococcota bacterium]|nr:hypothetical protein [Myxococcota bacterium]
MSTSQSPSSIGAGSGAAGSSAQASEASLAARAGQQGLRGVGFLTGLGLLAGFFLPWLRFGEVAAVSGLSLMVSSGTVVNALAGPSRGMLIIIPVAGAALVASSVLAPRLVPLVSLLSGLSILLFGLFTLARVFIATVGLGMWIVVVAALVATAIGIAAAARSRSAR